MTGPTQRGLLSVARLHFRGLRGPGRSRLRWTDWAWMVVIPIGSGTAAFAADLHIEPTGSLLSATTLLVGAMLTLFVFLTNLRVKIEETPEYAYRRRLQRLIAGATISSLYVAVVALAASLALALAGGLGGPAWAGAIWERLGAALVTALLVHLGVGLMTVIRRAFAVYDGVFGKDFGPDLDIVVDLPEVDDRERRAGHP